MKKILLSAALIAASFTTVAQVGVGTTDPSAALDVVSTGATNATKALEITNSAATEMVTVLDDGKVGIGTTSPTEKLEINGASLIGNVKRIQDVGDPNRTIFQNKTADTNINFSISPNSTGPQYVGFEVSSTDDNTDRTNISKFGILTGTLATGFNEYRVRSYSGGTGGVYPITFGFQPSSGVWSESVRLSTNGNVGIGVSSPTYKLQTLDGGVFFANSNSTSTNYYIGATIGANNGLQIINSNLNETRYEFYTGGSSKLNITHSGNVGIGTLTPTEKLHVIGNILATGTITPDYVFESYFEGESTLKPSYKMMSLEEIESFTKDNKHLPGVPSAKEVEEKGGIILNRASEINLEKIEELFLHTIEQEKQIDALKVQLKALLDAVK